VKTPLSIGQNPSPNFGARAEGSPIDTLILHYTGMESEERALAWLCDPESAVSSHYFVFDDGRIVQLVDEQDRAWHAGQSSWKGVTDINSRSIGIEITNPGHEFGYRPFPDAQIAAVIGLCRDILGRHAIPPERVLAHSDIAPLRKEDPGEFFPWKKLHDAGVGYWVEPDPIVAGPVFKAGDRSGDVARLKRRFAKYGYPIAETDAFDEDTSAVVRAFQRHFRPALVDGIADGSTLRTLERLAAPLRRK
jgi:N-acetylmuramoyl-L-alanine amidase